MSEQPQFYFPDLPGNPGVPFRPEKPEGFRIPLLYFAVISTQEAAASTPHWHPNADEFSYFIEGEGIVRLSPPGAEDLEYRVKAGDAILFPQGWPHSFENLGDQSHPLKFLAFFNNPEFKLIEVDQPIDPRK